MDPSAEDELPLTIDWDRLFDIEVAAGMLSGKHGDRRNGVDDELEVGELDSDIISGRESVSKSGDWARGITREGIGRCSAVGDSGSKSGDADRFGMLFGDRDRFRVDGDGGSESGVLVRLFGVLQIED
jgi:hypothetical protein